MNKNTHINILVTSPKGYAARLVKAFEESAQNAIFHPVSVPMIHTEVYTDSDDFQYLMRHLNEFDYLAFCSRKAIEAFTIGLNETGTSLPTSIKLCAIGKDNEFLVESLHTEPAFISTEPSPRGIINHLKGITESVGKRIGVLAPQVIGMEEPTIVPDFINGLKDIGMNPTRITAYQTKAADTALLEETIQQILTHQFDAVIFTSGTEIKVFLQMVPAGMSAAEFVKGLSILCYGPYTASCAISYGLKVDFTSKAFGSFQELVQQLSSYYDKKQR